MMGGAGPVADDEQPALIGRYGQLQDEEPAEVDRADRLADLLVEAFGTAGVAARRAPAIGGPWLSVGVVLDGASYLISAAWPSSPVGQEQVEALGQAAAGRPGVRLAVLSMAGYEPGVQPASDPLIVLLDRVHLEAVLCGLVEPGILLAEAAHRAVFDTEPYTSLTNLLIGDTAPSPVAQFVTSDRLPAPWPLQVGAAPGIPVWHLLSGDAGWAEPLGAAAMGADRILITVADGIVEVDRKRGTTDWLLPLPGCRGTPLVAADGSVLTLCADAIVRWKDGILTPVGGGFDDARALLVGPGGQPWVLSGRGPTFGTGAGTLALTQLGGAPGRQQRHHIHFDANVHTAGWLADLRFFLASGSNSAVVDLARSTGVRREDWIETRQHSPGHLVVADPQTVITASPDHSGMRATIYRTDITTRTSTLVAELATNRVHGLASAPDDDLLLLGDVRGNNVLVPHPVLICVGPVQPNIDADAGPAGAGTGVSPAAAQPRPGSTHPATDPVRDAPVTAAGIEPDDRYNQVQLAACGSRRDYTLDARPIASGGQAIVFGARHKATGTRVAFKKLHSRNHDDVARMRREVEAAQLFGGHPHVVPVLDFSPTYDWLVMPLAVDTAQTLAAKLRNEQVLRDLVIEVCDALREPHQQGWIHRDLKPDNILHLDGRWAVADWGLGRRPRGQTTDPPPHRNR